LALTWGLPLVPVNHLEGHIYANWLSLPGEEPVPPPEFPLVCLVVSGGHTELVFMRGHGEYELLGRTSAGAAGEAFAMGGLILGLGCPGGPPIERRAEKGRSGRFTCSRAWLANSCGFSFSALTPAVLPVVEM